MPNEPKADGDSARCGRCGGSGCVWGEATAIACPQCRGLGWVATLAKPAPQPVEGVSDEELRSVAVLAYDVELERQRATGAPISTDAAGYASRRELFNLGASRSAAAKDARTAELEKRPTFREASELQSLLVAVHAAINNRTPHGPKENARCTIEWIEEAKETIAELRTEVATERERCARVCDEAARDVLGQPPAAFVSTDPAVARAYEDAARRIREEPAK